MRVTSNMTADNALYNIQQGRKKLDRLQGLAASGANIQTPSDDPIVTKTLLDINEKLTEQEQYQSNITKTLTGLQITDTALAGISDIVAQTKKLIGTIASGSTDATIRNTVTSQLLELKKQVIDLGNTQFGDQYIFGGYNNNIKPFITVNLTGDSSNGSFVLTNIDTTSLNDGMLISGVGIPPNTTITVNSPPGPAGSVTLSNAATATGAGASISLEGFVGTNNNIDVEINRNSTITTNISGGELLHGTGAARYGNVNIIAVMEQLYDAVTNNNVAGLRTGAAQLEQGASQLTNARSDVASRMIRLNNASKMNENNKNTLKSIVGNIQNVDYAKVAVELSKQQTAFEASLSATAKISQLSLLDYLR